MSDRPAITFHPARLAQRFSALQPAQDPVQSAKAGIPACCLQTTLRVGSTVAGRVCELAAPSSASAVPSLQIVAVAQPDAEAAAGIVIGAKGPSECPPGQPNEVQVQAGGGTMLKKQIPFERWVLPMRSTLDFSRLAKDSAALLTAVHPFRLRHLPPAACLISVPGCSAVGTNASVLVFPDVHWDGEIRTQTIPDATVPKGFRIEWEGSVRAWCGADEWRPQTWEDVLRWCPWLDVLDPLARTIAAIAALRAGARDQGFDNPRLVKAEALKWMGPRVSATTEARLGEQPRGPLVEPFLAFRCEASPLIAASGEMSLLGHWLENPLWRQRLAPLLTGILAAHPAEIAQEIGIWLVAEGKVDCRIQHEERPPEAPVRDMAESQGGIALHLEGRSHRDYETIVVRAGGTSRPEDPSEITMELHPPEEAAAGSIGHCRARVAFSGLSVWSLEKRRPGLRIRRLGDGASTSGEDRPSPLAALLAPRHWPSEAATAPAPVPWYPT